MQKLKQVISAQASRDGAGVKINRLAGSQLQQTLNPFLMIDEIKSEDAADYIGGFPEHPHRGFETITYMKVGKMRHRDHMGNEGVIGAGDVQWMTAGSGVLHSEMPEQDDGLLHGFQFWLNLPADEKMQPAQYHDIRSGEIVEQSLSAGGLIRVIAGNVSVANQSLRGPLPARSTQPTLLDVQLSANESTTITFADDKDIFIYAYQGGTTELLNGQLGVYSTAQTLELTASSGGAQLLVLSGKPINEPVVQYGPFVMNTRQQIDQALQDFNDPAYLAELSAG